MIRRPPRSTLDRSSAASDVYKRQITSRAKQNPQRIVFAEADTYKILKAAQIVRDEGIAKPILLGNLGKIRQLIEENNLDLGDTPIIDPRLEEDKRHEFGEIFFKKRKRRGFTLYEAKKIMNERNYYGAMMVEVGEADAMISGLTRKYSDTIRPALQIIGTQDDVKKVAGMYIICLLYTSDAADERSSVDLGGRRIIKKKNKL